jgi:hypothetical protein
MKTATKCRLPDSEIKFMPNDWDFRENKPYELVIAFQRGELEYCTLYKVECGKGTYTKVKFDGEFYTWGRPIEFNKVNSNSWSHPCKGMSVCLINKNYHNFIDKYNEQLQRELIATNEHINTLSTLFI